MIKLLTVIFLLICSCSPAITVRIVHESTPVDTVKEAVIIGTEEFSVIAWEKRVQNIKDTLWIDAAVQVETLREDHWKMREVEWSGNFRSEVRLKVLTWVESPVPQHSNPGQEIDYGERTYIFIWRRDPINGLWKREKEKQ